MYNLTVTDPNPSGGAGAINTTAQASVSPGNPATLRARMNPNDNREVGVMGLADTGGAAVNAIASVTLSDGNHTSSQSFVPQAAPTPGAITSGTPGGEIDPPAWML